VELVRDQWYIGAYAGELAGDVLLDRRIAGEPVVLYRAADGTATALANRCVHRRYPLSEGKLDERGNLVCGYHGFTYEPSGRCVAVPAQQRVPRTARVAAFPVRERDGLVWVWVGDPAAADEARIPSLPFLDSPDWSVVRGVRLIKCRYDLLVDNLMDLSHETYLHSEWIGTPEVAETPTTTRTDEDANVVRVSRHMENVPCPPSYQPSMRAKGFDGLIDRWQDIEYHAPGLYLLHTRIAPPGAPVGPDGDDPQAAHRKIVYGITPASAGSTHDFWMVARDHEVGDPAADERGTKSQQAVLLQDAIALEVLEETLQTEPAGYQELSVNIDTGALAARRMLARLASGGAVDRPAGATVPA
jgi:phenylpropionate dioxygenase-like ring-hydroxylating dioxygenase large terminal subunit